MKQPARSVVLMWTLSLGASSLFALPAAAFAQDAANTVRLADVMMRDACVLADEASQTYYIVSSARGAAVRAYTSKDLVTWEGPHIIYRTPRELWGEDVRIRSTWAPELHEHEGRYYLFLTFDSEARLPEQWEPVGDGGGAHRSLPRQRGAVGRAVGGMGVLGHRRAVAARSTSGKLFMPWSSFSETGYTVGLAVPRTLLARRRQYASTTTRSTSPSRAGGSVSTTPSAFCVKGTRVLASRRVAEATLFGSGGSASSG